MHRTSQTPPLEGVITNHFTITIYVFLTFPTLNVKPNYIMGSFEI